MQTVAHGEADLALQKFLYGLRGGFGEGTDAAGAGPIQAAQLDSHRGHLC